MEVTAARMTISFGKKSDYEKLTPLLRRNSDKFKLNFDNYSTAAKKIIEDKNYGFFVVAEQAGEFVAFVLMGVWWSH